MSNLEEKKRIEKTAHTSPYSNSTLVVPSNILQHEEKALDSAATSTTPSATDTIPVTTIAPPPALSQLSYPDGPPRLPYDLHNHKLTICFFWFLIIAEVCLIPISFYYGLWFGTTLNHGALFAIITSVFGFVTGYEYASRAVHLLLPRDKYRPLNNSNRFWNFDTVQWVLVGPYTVMTGVLIGFSIPTEPLVRGLAIPMALGMIILGSFFIMSGIAYWRGWRLKYFRLSSHVIGDLCPPLTFCIIEDVVAVDGRGGRLYREAIMKRYQASPRFRRMLVEVLWFWAIPAVVLGIVLLVLIYEVRKEVAYGLGWGIPSIWAGIWALLTTVWVKRSLRIEHETWVSDRAVPP